MQFKTSYTCRLPTNVFGTWPLTFTCTRTYIHTYECRKKHSNFDSQNVWTTRLTRKPRQKVCQYLFDRYLLVKKLSHISSFCQEDLLSPLSFICLAHRHINNTCTFSNIRMYICTIVCITINSSNNKYGNALHSYQRFCITLLPQSTCYRTHTHTHRRICASTVCPLGCMRILVVIFNRLL